MTMNTYPDFIETANAAATRLKPTFADKLKYSFLKMPYACKVCEKAPDESTAAILEAFTLLPQYKLVVAANWSSTKKANELYKKYSRAANVILLHKPALQRDVRLITENCFVYIQDAGGNSIASLSCAMLAGLPVIAYKDEENIKLTNHKALYFSTANELQKIILEKNITDLKKTGAEMYKSAQMILTQQY